MPNSDRNQFASLIVGYCNNKYTKLGHCRCYSCKLPRPINAIWDTARKIVVNKVQKENVGVISIHFCNRARFDKLKVFSSSFCLLTVKEM